MFHLPNDDHALLQFRKGPSQLHHSSLESEHFANCLPQVQTFQGILDLTGIPKHEIANHLLSLVHPKVNVLLKRPATRELGDGDKLMINPKYTNAMLNVQIPLLKVCFSALGAANYWER